MRRRDRTTVRRRATQVLAAMTLALAATGCLDNMYPTANHHASCRSTSYSDMFSYCQTDNADLTYGLTSGTTAQHSYIAALMEGQFEPTVLSVSWENPIVYTGDAETDIVFQIGASLPIGVDGATWCQGAVNMKACDQHYVRLRANRVGWSYGSTCHEAGHAVGLTHGAQANPVTDDEAPILGCLKTPSGGTTTLGEHNKTMINNTY